ncbi:hypothetical protein ABFS83_13G116200 [Erythranthe nasuta]
MHRRWRRHTKVISSSSKLALGLEMHYEKKKKKTMTATNTTPADIEKMARENAVVIFSQSTCCLCHAVKRLFSGMGVSPMVHELDEHPKGKHLYRALMRLVMTTATTAAATGSAAAVPVVFIGGNLVGGIDAVLASHINGTLTPILKQAGAIWL